MRRERRWRVDPPDDESAAPREGAAAGNSAEATEPASSPPLEQELKRLEAIVQRLERDEIPLDQALALFEEGIAIARSARGKLEAAEGRVREILREAGDAFRLRDLDA